MLELKAGSSFLLAWTYNKAGVDCLQNLASENGNKKVPQEELRNLGRINLGQRTGAHPEDSLSNS